MTVGKRMVSESRPAPPDAGLARELWHLLEPIHAVVYFHPRAKETYEAVGLKGYWMGYFASRSAALGTVSAEVVHATFYNFSRRMVERAIPDAWRRSTPDAVLKARRELAAEALQEKLGEAEQSAVREAAELARAVALGCDHSGRPLSAAHASLPWPDEPALALWHAATILREHRGDGHVAVLLANGIDGCEANVLAVAGGRAAGEQQRQFRGWSESEWQAAEARLQTRGLYDDGQLMNEGAGLTNDIEMATDRLALGPYTQAGSSDTRRLAAALEPLARRITESGAIPFPNPMGLTR